MLCGYALQATAGSRDWSAGADKARRPHHSLKGVQPYGDLGAILSKLTQTSKKDSKSAQNDSAAGKLGFPDRDAGSLRIPLGLGSEALHPKKKLHGNVVLIY
jgi:hypothetical protein